MKKKLIHGLSHDLGIVHKIWLTMRLIVILFFVSLVHVSASVYSQKTKLNIKVENATLQQIFDMIQDQSEFDFFYKNEQIPADAKVSVDAKNETIEAILNNILKETGLKYGLVDKDIVIIPIESVAGQQQKKTISGKVTDASGATLPGVSVVVKGTTNGVITDMDGNYSLANIPENAILQFSFVGMKMQEILVGNKATINIILAEDAIGLEEVVAIGYGTSKKSDLTGSIASVKTDKLLNKPAVNVGQALSGKVSGVEIFENGGSPDGKIQVRIRGNNSINSSNDPLYVVDGVIGVANINLLNPNEIESLEVLKDASATAIYGARGANGVIMITTKRGIKADKAVIAYDGYVSIGTMANKLPLMNAKVWYSPLLGQKS